MIERKLNSDSLFYTLQKNYFLLFACSLVLFSNCNLDQTASQSLDIPGYVISRTYRQNLLGLNHVSSANDTVIYNFEIITPSNANPVNLKQVIKYLFQDFCNINRSQFNHIKIYGRYKDGDKIEQSLILNETTQNFISSLSRFNTAYYKKAMNEFFTLDSSFGKRVEVLQILSYELGISKSQVSNFQNDEFGISAMNFIYSYFQDCYTGKMGINEKILTKTLENMKTNEDYGLTVIQDLEKFFGENCEKISGNK